MSHDVVIRVPCMLRVWHHMKRRGGSRVLSWCCCENGAPNVQAQANGDDMSSFVLTPLGKENGTALKSEEELKEMKKSDVLQSCHLVTHSESQGVYIPLEMKNPLHCEKTHPDLKILGTFHGSVSVL